MDWVTWLGMMAGAYPLWVAWQANRRTSLRHAIAWGILAWVAWVLTVTPGLSGNVIGQCRYLALCLTGCAGIAVLGARRPGVDAWNFVVSGLLVVLLLPVAESVLHEGTLILDGPRWLFLWLILVFGFGNYIPTRFCLAAGVFLFWSLKELEDLGITPKISEHALLLMALALWMPLVIEGAHPDEPGTVNRLWLAFRDRFGVIWGLRVQEMFNRAAVNAQLPARLSWWGVKFDVDANATSADAEAALAILKALLIRFGDVEPAHQGQSTPVRPET